MIECTCKEFPDYWKGESHEWDCPYLWLEERQR